MRQKSKPFEGKKKETRKLLQVPPKAGKVSAVFPQNINLTKGVKQT